MLHDAVIEATCDREGCYESVFVPMEWVYRNQSESSGYYDHRDATVEEGLANLEWIVRGGKHFCSLYCEEKS